MEEIGTAVIRRCLMVSAWFTLGEDIIRTVYTSLPTCYVLAFVYSKSS